MGKPTEVTREDSGADGSHHPHRAAGLVNQSPSVCNLEGIAIFRYRSTPVVVWHPGEKPEDPWSVAGLGPGRNKL
jgi:hypothetical protein